MRLTLLSLLFFSITTLFAQDQIQLVNGDFISGWVLEVGQEIRYRQADFPDGPVYVLLRPEVAMITYSNGREELFNLNTITTTSEGTNTFAVRQRYLRVQQGGRFYEGLLLISRADFEARLQSIPGVYEKYKSGRGLVTGGYVLGGVGLFATAVGFVSGVSSTNSSFRTPGTSSDFGRGSGGVAAGLFLVLGGGIMAAVGIQKVRRAVDEYNVSVRDEVGFVPIINNNGIGMAMRF